MSSSMRISKSKSAAACNWAQHMRRLLTATDESTTVLSKESHSKAANGGKSKPIVIVQEQSFTDMFVRPPPTSQTKRKISTSSSPSSKSKLSPAKRPSSEHKASSLRPYPAEPITHTKQANPFILNSSSHDLRRFLEQVGTDPREARYWLQQFQQSSDSDIPFAVVQVDSEVLQCTDMLDSLGSCLSFLQRNGMKCVVVHGVTLPADPDDLPIDLQVVRSQLSEATMQLVSTLESHGTHARPFFSGNGIIQATENTQDGNVSSNIGSVCDVSVSTVQWALSSGHVPVLQSIGETTDDGGGRIVVLDVGEVTARLAEQLKPRKVLFINTHGGFVDGRGEPIPNVNLPTHWEHSPNSEERWADDVQSRVHYIGNLLSNLPEQSSVVITSAKSLLAELFTHRGSGTFFKITEPVLVYKSLEEVDLDRLTKLFNRSFGKDLHDDYFQEMQDKLHTLYLSKDYNAAAVVVETEGGTIPYLDKFAVSQAKQGEGTGEMLWECIERDFPKLFWRSKVTNRINPWYFKHCDGTWSKGGEWMVFWYGVPDHKDTSQLIDFALSLPASFKGPESHT